MIALDVPLTGKPPLLDVVGADGADVSIDGRPVGEAPFARPLELTPGRHFVAVSRLGHKPYSAELDFQHGAVTGIELDLPATNQRRVAWSALTVSGLSIATAAALTGVAFAEQSRAQSIEDEQAAGNIDDERRLEHNDAIALRDDLRLAAIVTAGAGAAVGIAGLFMYLLDEPTVVPPSAASPDREDDAPEAPPPPDVELIGAGDLGLGVRVGF